MNIFVLLQDIIRAKYYSQFGNGEVVNLLQPGKLQSQIFIDKYRSLQDQGHQPEALWDLTVQVSGK